MSSRRKVSGLRVLVTGASSGLGAECAKQFAKKDAWIIIVARRRSRLFQIAKLIRQGGGRVTTIQADVMDLADIHRVQTIVNSEAGGVDILVNNAGAYCQGFSLVETSPEDWNRIMNTNLRAPYLICRAFVPGMLDRKYGRIVNVTSATNTLEDVGAFRISKVGLEVLTAVLAVELKETDVTATAFNPGWMKTETSYTGRSPRGAADALIELVQRGPNFLNGSFIDLKWSGRRFRLIRRPPMRGPFGF
jgi:3-oxoacyl-[acyl-carrier protein] reductase